MRKGKQNKNKIDRFSLPSSGIHFFIGFFFFLSHSLAEMANAGVLDGYFRAKGKKCWWRDNDIRSFYFIFISRLFLVFFLIFFFFWCSFEDPTEIGQFERLVEMGKSASTAILGRRTLKEDIKFRPSDLHRKFGYF